MRFVRVKGQSMWPSYRNGDLLLVARYRLRKPRPGDDVVFTRPQLGSLLKRIERIDGDRIRLCGLSSLSADPETWGEIDAATIRNSERVLLRLSR